MSQPGPFLLEVPNTNEKEAQVAQTKYNQIGEKTKQVTAAEVYQLTNETLQEIFQLDMAAGRYEAQDIWDVLIAAAVERGTGLGLKPRRLYLDRGFDNI